MKKHLLVAIAFSVSIAPPAFAVGVGEVDHTKLKREAKSCDAANKPYTPTYSPSRSSGGRTGAVPARDTQEQRAPSALP